MRPETPSIVGEAHRAAAVAMLPHQLQRAGVGFALAELGPDELAELVRVAQEWSPEDPGPMASPFGRLAELGAELVRTLGPRRVGDLAAVLADFLPPAELDDGQALDVLRALGHPDVRFVTLDELVQRSGVHAHDELVTALGVLQRRRFVTWSVAPRDSERWPRPTVAATTLGLSYLHHAGAAGASH